MTTLATIPARAGSKRLPGKNIVDFLGRPLIAYTIEAALTTCDRVVVSTDGHEIAEVAKTYGAEVLMRPDHLAGDLATSESVVEHVLGKVAAETVVLLQPTSPLRTANDIRACLDIHARTGRPVVSISPTDKYLGLQADTHFVPNGAIYVAKAGSSWWEAATYYAMPRERSVDIDTLADLDRARSYRVDELMAYQMVQ